MCLSDRIFGVGGSRVGFALGCDDEGPDLENGWKGGVYALRLDD